MVLYIGIAWLSAVLIMQTAKCAMDGCHDSTQPASHHVAQLILTQLTLCGCMGMPLKSVTILLAEAMWTGRIPVRRPPIWSALKQ